MADKIILEPAAKGYRKLPSPIQSGNNNFLSKTENCGQYLWNEVMLNLALQNLNKSRI